MDPGLTTSAYNTDTFEVEMTPSSNWRSLSDAFGAYVNFYAGAEPACTVDNLRPEQSPVRVRCRNAAGASRWSAPTSPRAKSPSTAAAWSRRHLRLGPDPDPRRGSRPGASRPVPRASPSPSTPKIGASRWRRRRRGALTAEVLPGGRRLRVESLSPGTGKGRGA